MAEYKSEKIMVCKKSEKIMVCTPLVCTPLVMVCSDGDLTEVHAGREGLRI